MDFTFEKVKYEVKNLTEFQQVMVMEFHTEEAVLEVMKYRGYATVEMYEKLVSLGVYIGPTIYQVADLVSMDESLVLGYGLVDKRMQFSLEGRYILPIRAIDGEVKGLAGWSPINEPKYMLTSSKGFRKALSLYNFDEAFRRAYEEFGGTVILVEGYFDAISLSALGYPVVAAMGLEMTGLKYELLKRFNKVIAIPDSDKGGAKVSPYRYQGYKNKTWDFHVFVELPLGYDVDEFVRDDVERARSVIDEVLLTDNRYLKID